MPESLLGPDPVVFVTGGGSGIGRAMALMAARYGARVAVGDVNEPGARETVGLIAEAGGTALALALDVTSQQQTTTAVEHCEARFGPITGLITCAGTSQPQPSEDMTDAVWERIIGLNVTGTMLSCQTVGVRMLARGMGAIVTIGSTDSLGGHGGRAHYSASKHAVVGLTKVLALEWGHLGVRVNCLAPGAVDTPLLRGGVPADQIQEVLFDRTPMERLGSGDDMAGAAMFLLSSLASYVNGAVLPVDGGVTTGYIARWNGRDLASNTLLLSGAYRQR